jgi:hypothetical protein
LKILSDNELAKSYAFLEAKIAALGHGDAPQWLSRLTDRNGMRTTQLSALHKEVRESKLSDEQKGLLLPLIQELRQSMTQDEYQKSLPNRPRTNSGRNMISYLLSMTANNKLRGSSGTISTVIAAEECAPQPIKNDQQLANNEQ